MNYFFTYLLQGLQKTPYDKWRKKIFFHLVIFIQFLLSKMLPYEAKSQHNNIISISTSLKYKRSVDELSSVVELLQPPLLLKILF